MSANGDGNGGDGDDGDSGPGTREVAYRLFAAEFDDCDLQFSESDEERAPNFVITPTGGRVNRLFLVGVLTELEQVNQSMLRARIVDPTGAFVVYAGQYQPEALSFLERTDPPAFLAVTGKARTYQPDDSDVVYSSVRPESISEVDAATRDRWVVSTAEQTLDRIGVMAAAIESGHSGDALRERLEAEGVAPALAQGVALAREHYGTTPGYLDALSDLSLDAARVVANELEEAGSLDVAPDEGGEADLDALRTADAPSISAAAAGQTGAAAGESDERTTSAEPDATATGADTGETTATAETTSGTTEETTADTATGATSTETANETTGETASETATAPETGTAGTTDAADADTRASESAGGDAAEETATAGTGTDEPAGTSETDAGDADDDIGEFEPGEFDAEEPEEDPLGEEVREQVEEEYGTEFSTGTEVESEPDLEPEAEPEPEPATETDAEPEAKSAAEAAEAEPEEEEEEEPATEPAAESSEEPADEPAGEVDLSEAVMDAMRDLDDGDGAPTDAVIDRVADRTGASPDEVDEAVQDALMGGQCYEPEDGRLKPI